MSKKSGGTFTFIPLILSSKDEIKALTLWAREQERRKKWKDVSLAVTTEDISGTRTSFKVTVETEEARDRFYDEMRLYIRAWRDGLKAHEEKLRRSDVAKKAAATRKANRGLSPQTRAGLGAAGDFMGALAKVTE